MSSGVWSEARCQYFLATGWNNRCHETAPGGFSVNEAVTGARSAGWVKLKGKWCCPTCLQIAKGMK